MTEKQKRDGFIDGNALLEPRAVVMSAGTGKAADKATVVGSKLLVPIIDRTADDQGAGFVIGMGGNTLKRRDESKRRRSATTPKAPRPKKGNAKSKQQ